MKLRTPERNKPRHPSSKDVLHLPETERSPYAQLEVLFEENRENVVESVERNIHDEHQFSSTDLARTLGATLILEQAFTRPILPSELRQRAVAALHSPRLIDLCRESVDRPGFDVQMLWFQAAIAQYFPEDRPKLGITNEVFDGWVDQFSAGADQLTYEEKSIVLSYLAQLRPDRLVRCRQMLEMIGFNQHDLGVETWILRHQLLKRYDKSKAQSLAATRLLQPERCLTDDEKQALLFVFGEKTRFGSFKRSADEYANIALLLAPQVSIGSDGKVLLQQPTPTHSSPGLPLRPEV